MNPNNERRLDPSGWVSRQLQLPPLPAEVDVRGRLLNQVADADFVPSLHLDAALRAQGKAMDEMSEPLSAHIWVDESARLREAVESFAATFFELEPETRDQRWWELAEQCSFAPQLHYRLEELQRGLKVVLRQSPDDSPHLRQLERDLARLFVEPISKRAAGRSSLLQNLRRNDIDPEALANKLWQTNPALATITQDWMTLIEEAKQEAWSIKAAAKRVNVRSKTHSSGEAQSSGGLFGRMGVGVIIMLVLGLARMCSGLNQSNTSANKPALPKAPLYQPMNYKADDEYLRGVLERQRLENLKKGVPSKTEGSGFGLPPRTAPYRPSFDRPDFPTTRDGRPLLPNRDKPGGRP